MMVVKTAALSSHFDEGKQQPRLPFQRKITAAAAAGYKHAETAAAAGYKTEAAAAPDAAAAND